MPGSTMEGLAMQGWRRKTATLLALAVSGCVPRQQYFEASSRPFMAPDGALAYWIECVRAQINCFDEAQRRCPYGYNVITANEQHGTVTETEARAGGNQYFAASRENSVQMPTFQGSMAIQCRNAPPPVAAQVPLAAPTSLAPPTPPAPKFGLFRGRDGTVYRVAPEGKQEALRAGWIQIGEE